MAGGELQWDAGATGITSYANLRNSSGAVYNLLSGQFETSGFFSGSYSGAYPISGTEQGITAYFTAPFPSGIAPGYYNIVAKQQGGVFPVQTDISIANGNLWWTGSGIQTFPTNFGALLITSGRVTSLSGANAIVPPSSLSGLVANSGLFVSVPIATISGTVANSGLFVSVPIATLSGVQPISGATVSVPTASISGTTVVVPIASISGAVANSGLFVSVPIATISGVVANSGLFVSVPTSSISGVVANSGLFVNAAGTVASGLFVTVPISSISGVNPASGASVNATVGSGIYATVPISSISGVNVVATASVASGTLYLASGSIFSTTFASGVVTQSGGVYLASGQAVSLNSGQQVITSMNLDKSGYTLSASGLDTIQVESGMNLRQAQAAIAASVAGRLSGAGTPTMKFDGANASGTTRITAGLDGSGNRTSVILNLPT